MGKKIVLTKLFIAGFFYELLTPSTTVIRVRICQPANLGARVLIFTFII